MFLIGISAQLMIYLLVPAFLFVCFYYKEPYENPENTVLFPVEQSYMQYVETQESCFFFAETEIQTDSQHIPVWPTTKKVKYPSRPTTMPVYPILQIPLLRAPPDFSAIY